MNRRTDKRGRKDDAQGVLGPTVDFLREHAPFNRMTTLHTEFLAKHLRLGFYPKGKAVTEPDRGPVHTLYIVKQGRVRDDFTVSRLLIASAAREFGPGECFPVDSLLAHRPVTTAQRAVQDTFCFELDREHFEQLLTQSSVFRSFCTQLRTVVLAQ